MTRRPYVLSRSAGADLSHISRYTAEKWGETQRQAYVQQLQDAATDLALGRGAFKDWSAVLPGLRMKTVASHCIFAVHRPGRPALVLAILHERMDLLVRLKSRLANP